MSCAGKTHEMPHTNVSSGKFAPFSVQCCRVLENHSKDISSFKKCQLAAPGGYFKVNGSIGKVNIKQKMKQAGDVNSQ